MDKCPGLTSLGMDCQLGASKTTALLSKLGPQLQYLQLSPLVQIGLNKLIALLNKFDYIDLRALEYKSRKNDLIDKELFLSFISKHGNKLRRLLIKPMWGMDSEIGAKILEICPLVNKHKYVDLKFSEWHGFSAAEERGYTLKLKYVR